MMRTREEIERDREKYVDDVVKHIIIELLLDIRDILDKNGVVVRK